MKKSSYFATIVAGLLLMMSSCSKDEVKMEAADPDKAILSFGAILNDLVQNKQGLKQQITYFPECSDALPSYVEVVLSGTADVGTMENPLVVEINPIPADYDGDGEEEFFTMESSDLELEAGPYSLEFFAVYDANDNLIWLAPYEDGDFNTWIDNLPLEFDLGVGTKKYLDVDVLCFDDRLVNEYGYLFFDLETTEAIEFCIFGNVCDQNGRHSVAEYDVDVWYGRDDSGVVLYTNVGNSLGTNDNGDVFSEPVCFSLPDREGDDSYYFEISIEGEVIRSGAITDEDVRDLFGSGDDVDYYHFREGECSSFDSPSLFEGNEQIGITDVIWDFNFIHDGERGWPAEVTFYEDGTAFYTEPAAPGQFDFWGTWSVEGNIITYDMDSNTEDDRNYILTGLIEGENMSGTYTFGELDYPWTATKS